MGGSLRAAYEFFRQSRNKEYREQDVGSYLRLTSYL
jgi:hypothetical protein